MAKRGGVFVPGMVTTIGSLPHAGLDDAVRFVLDGEPDLPAAPQLPARSWREGMLAQVAVAVPGVSVHPDGRLSLDPPGGGRGSLTAAAASPFDPAAHEGALAFLAVSRARARTGPVKLQLTGPVTLGLALVDAGAPATAAFPAATLAVRSTAQALVAAAHSALPAAQVSLWLDEPWLVRPDAPSAGAVTAILAGALAALGPTVTSGVHCCGRIDWSSVVDAGPTVLSMPVDLPGTEPSTAAIDAHLRRGGWIAWGAVPTDRPVTTDEQGALWGHLVARWSALAAAGCDLALVRRRALVTPACGLAGRTVAEAATAVDLTRRLGARAAAAAARF
jgi:hypothetical protein